MTSPLTKWRCGCPSTCANWSALRCRLSYTTTSLPSSRRWTRCDPMKPAPPVMHTRFPVRAMSPLLLTAVAGPDQLGRRRPAGCAVVTQGEQLFLRHAALVQHGQLVARTLERGDDHQVVHHLVVLGDGPDRH